MPKKKNIRVNFTVLFPGGQIKLGQCNLNPELNPEIAGFEAGKAIGRVIKRMKLPATTEES